MKKVYSFAIFFLFFTAAANAQNWAEERTYFSGGNAAPRIDGLFTRSLGKKAGIFIWFQVQKGYSQAYGGVTYAPRPWIQLAIGAGLEEAKNPPRAGGYIWMGNKRTSLLLIGEYGGSGLWGKTEFNYKVNRVVGIGAISERFKGTGPRIEIHIPHSPIIVWAAPMIYKGAPTGLIGLRVNF